MRAFGDRHNVAEQHRPGHRSDPAWVRRDPGGNVGDIVRNIAGDPARAILDDATDTDIEHDCTRLDVGRGDDARNACRGNDDIRATQVIAEVPRAGVGEGDCCIVFSTGQEWTDGAADGHTPTDYDDVFT